jgi:hypothetical protein
MKPAQTKSNKNEVINHETKIAFLLILVVHPVGFGRLQCGWGHRTGR